MLPLRRPSTSSRRKPSLSSSWRPSSSCSWPLGAFSATRCRRCVLDRACCSTHATRHAVTHATCHAVTNATCHAVTWVSAPFPGNRLEPHVAACLSSPPSRNSISLPKTQHPQCAPLCARHRRSSNASSEPPTEPCRSCEANGGACLDASAAPGTGRHCSLGSDGKPSSCGATVTGDSRRSSTRARRVALSIAGARHPRGHKRRARRTYGLAKWAWGHVRHVRLTSVGPGALCRGRRFVLPHQEG